MKKNSPTLKEIFLDALENYKKRNFEAAEKLCNKILSIDNEHFDSFVLLSNMEAIKRNFKKAKEYLEKANEIKPRDVTVLNNLGTANKELGNIQKSINFYEDVLKIEPNHTNAQYNLGTIYYNLREIKKAKTAFEKTIKVQPNYALAFVNLANVNVELKDYEEAKINYKKALKINSKLVGAHNNLGLVYRELNDYKNAIESYEKTIKLNPKHGGAYHNMALAFKELGDFNKAISSHKMAIKQEPENFLNYFYLSELDQNILSDDLRKKINKILENKNLSASDLAYGNYLLSKYEKKDNKYEEELEFLKKGHKHFFESRKEKFTLGVKYCFQDVPQISKGVYVENKKEKNTNKIKPIFIVGVPRCGSTLVEKIIGSGLKFVPMGEETAIMENFINSKILEKKSLNLGNVINLRNEISDLYKKKGLIEVKHDYRFTDKSLNNFFYLKFIKDVFPNAKIINCKRDILSSIMSIFQNNITELAWTHDLDNVFKYFNNYFEIIRKYSETEPNSIYELEFEKLVNDPENESKKLMNFCELSWDKKCLEFYKRKDLISKTASNVQVRKAIYKHSLEKYLPYKKYLNQYGEKYSWFKK